MDDPGQVPDRDRDRWSRIHALLGAVLELPVAGRDAFLDRECRDDVDLRREIESLVRAAERTGALDRPPAAGARADMVAADMRLYETGRYRVLEELGHGGMGVVYRAEDVRLKRPVALKFLSLDRLDDEDAKARFIREARTASSLDHPNLCTIYEVDETPGGALFLAMALYEGETLKDRIGRGPVPLDDALDLAIQCAQGLRKAHESGVIHRDIKPSNLFVTRDGILKILDFGVAKLTGQTELTRTGTTVGTAAYMSPEQIRGEAVDQRTDVWALGAVLYEMLTGQPAFSGDSAVALIHSVLNDTPRPMRRLRPDAPSHLQDIVSKMLEKHPDSRYRLAADVLHDLTALRTALGAPRLARAGFTIKRLLRTPAFAIAATVLLIAALSAIAWTANRSARARWAREQAIPEVERLVDDGSFPEAYALAQQAARYVPDDPLLRMLNPKYAITFSIDSRPSGAAVYVRPYESPDTDTWQLLGRTPLTNEQLPRRVLRWRVEKDGFAPSEFATRASEDLFPERRTVAFTVELLRTGEHPPEMVLIPRGRTGEVRLVGGQELMVESVPAFLLDRLEVTNKEFKEFVDAKGYETDSYWQAAFRNDNAGLTWEEAKRRFVDNTSQPGPATWEFGDYPQGQDDYPVTGVSWYEATAYAQFRHKQLPTIYHWAKASVPDREPFFSLAPSIVFLSNFKGTGAVRTGLHQGLGPFGTYDMSGNVREWVSNKAPKGGWLLGSSWNDAPYYDRNPPQLPRADRSPVNGFRLMKELDGKAAPASMFDPVDLRPPTSPDPAPISEDVFEGYRAQFEYSPAVRSTVTPQVLEPSKYWRHEVVRLDTGYGDNMLVHLFLPLGSRQPYQSIVYFPGNDAFVYKPSSTFSPDYPPMPLDHIIKSGRALVHPVFQGSYERYREPENDPSPRTMRNWRWDLGRTLDYLETRRDFDSTKIVYVGTSFGARVAVPLLAVERRLRGALLLSGGLRNQPRPKSVEPLLYLPRITLPVLMLNGRYDEREQLKFFQLLGTEPSRKKIVQYETGHVFFPRKEYVNETLSWLNRLLGLPAQ